MELTPVYVSMAGIMVLIICLGIFVFLPWLLLRFLLRRIRTTQGRCILAGVFAGLFFGVCYLAHLTGFIGTSVARVERDHSISLPKSVSEIRCDGFLTLTTFIDDGAFTTFEISSTDLPTILSQFPKLKPHIVDPKEPLLPAPVGFGKLISRAC